MFARFTILA